MEIRRLLLPILVLTSNGITGCTGRMPPTITPPPPDILPPNPYVTESRSETRNFFIWVTPGGTTITFDALDFPGSFYPDQIAAILGPYCSKALVVPSVSVMIGPISGFNPDTGLPDENGNDGITIAVRNKETGTLGAIQVGIAGGRFAAARAREPYLRTSPYHPGRSVLTTALDDLNATLVEEVGYHACAHTVGTELDPPDAQAQSGKLHLDFLERPAVLFRPDGW